MIRRHFCRFIRQPEERRKEKEELVHTAGLSTLRLLVLDSAQTVEEDEDDSYEFDEEDVDDESDWSDGADASESNSEDESEVESERGGGGEGDRNDSENGRWEAVEDSDEKSYRRSSDGSSDEESNRVGKKGGKGKGKAIQGGSGARKSGRGKSEKGKGKEGRKKAGEQQSECEDEEAPRPGNPAAYKKKFTDFQVAQHIFKDLIAAFDLEQGRDPHEKSSIGARTKNAHAWFKDVCLNNADQMAQVRKAKREWNSQGAPPEKQAR